MRLLPLAALFGCSGIDTLFPVVGAVEVLKMASFAPVVGVAGYSPAPVVGVVLLRWSECVSRFSGGLRRAVGGNLHFPHAP